VPDAAEEQLRVIGQANALVSELADARRRVADSKTLKQSHVDALVNATLEYVKVPDGDAVSKRIRQDEAVEKIIAALSQLYITVFQVFGSTSSSKQAERTLWLTERVKSTLTISHAPIFNSMNVTGVSSDRRSRMNSALDSLNKLAVERMMFTFDNEDKTLLSISDRPWASELRYLLSASGLLNHVEEVTPGVTLVSYVQDNKALLIEARDSFIDLAVEVSSTQLATSSFNKIATAAADNKPQALKTYLETVATLMHDRMQQARWIAALERGEKNDARAVKKLIDLQMKDGKALYDICEADTEIGDLRFASSVNPKAAPAAKKYIGVLSSTDGPSGRPSRFISDTASIGDTTTTLTVDPGSEITVIDQELLSTLSENVARPAQSVTPVQFAAWNGTPDGELHNAYHVAIRPRWCDEPRWVLMYAARLSEIMPDKIIWGRDAAEQCGLVITMSRSAPVVCSAPPADAPVPPVLAAPDDTLPRVAVMAPDPSTPGLDGQCCADEVESPAEQQMFTAKSALDVALAKVDQCVALADHPALQDKIKTAMRAVYWRSKHAPKPAKLEPPISGVMLRTRLIPGAYPNSRAKERRRTAAQIAAIDAQTEEWLAHGVFEAVNDDSVSTTSAVLVVDKFDEQHVKSGERVCGDYRDVNRIVMRDCGKTVVVEDGLEKVSVGQYRSKFDGASYYTQLLIDETSRTIYTLQINRSLIVRPTRAQFGMRNAGAVAQRASDEIFGSLRGVWTYVDEVVGSHASLEEAVEDVCAILAAAAERNVVLNADKIVLITDWIVLMGHEVGPGLVRALPGRLQLLTDWPAPLSIKQTISFLAAANHYRAFIPSFSLWAGKLRAAAIHGRSFRWGPDAQAAFEDIRAALAAAATLQRIRKDEPLFITTDASADGIAFAIGQHDEEGILRMVYAGGRSTADYERRYSPMDLEGVAVLAAVHRMPHLLVGGAPVTVLTDSRPLVDFFTKAPQINDPDRAPVRARITAALQGFELAWRHVTSERNQIMDAASRAAWSPTSGVTPSGPDTVAHTLLPPVAHAPSAPRVAVITPIDNESPGANTPPITSVSHAAADDDDSADSDDQTEADETALRAPPTAGAAPPTDQLESSPWQTPTRVNDDDESSAAHVDAAISTDGATDASTELISHADGGEALVDDASTLSERAVPEGPANLPTAFNVPIELGSDVELDEVYAQERRAWAEAQRNDPALRTLFSHAHGIHQKSKSIQKREPSIDSDGRLFVAFGHDHARRLVVPSERAPATHQQLDHRSADATCAELQKAFWWPGMLKQVDDWCARCPICQTRLRAQRKTPDLAAFPNKARFAAVHIDVMPMPRSDAGNSCALMIIDRTTGAARAVPMKTKTSAEILEVYEREWVRVFGPPESLHPDDALEFNAKALRSMCGRHGTRLINVAPYNKQANDLVERFIQTIKRALLARMHGRNAGSWDKELSEAVWSYMSTSQAVRGGVSPYELTYGQAPVSPEAQRLQAIAPRPAFGVGEGAQAAQAVEQHVAALVPRALAARDKAAVKPLAAAQAAPTFALGDVVWVENTERAAECTEFENRQKRFGPYIVHSVDSTNARVQLRVLATGRVVTDRRSGNAGKPVWFATRRLTKTSGDVKEPHGAWLGEHDRNALPSAERTAQATLDAKESAFRVALQRRPAHVVVDKQWPATFDIGDGRIVDVVALRNSTLGPVATVVVSNGRAVEVWGKRYERIIRLARHLAPEVQRLRARHAPDALELAP
jgi:hypothetical protein